MFLTRGQPQRGRLTNFRYGTAGTTTTTTLASQGGLLINIDSATGDIAQTASGWIEDEKYGFYHREFATSTQAQFKTGVITGEKVLRMETLDATGVCRVLQIPAPNYSTAATNLANSAKLFPVKASTKYKFKFKGKGVGITGGGMDFPIFNSAGTYYAGGTSFAFSNTSDFVWYTTSFTTDSSAVWFGWIGFISAGSAGYFDIQVNSMTLEEVIEPVANSLVTPSPSLVSFTAVGSTDNIDQSQATQNDARGVGGDGSTAVITNKIAQQFTPTKSKFAGIIIRKIADIGTFTGTVTIKIVNNNAGAIGTTVYASKTLTNAEYQAIANDTDYTVILPCNLTADGSTLYWCTIEASTSDALNYARIRVQSGNPYTGGIFQAYYSGAWNTVAFDMYFKTLYYKPTTNFKASQNNSNVSISADEDGFLTGGVFNLVNGTYSYTAAAVVGQSIVPNLVTATNASGTSSFAYIVSTDQVIKGGSAAGVHVMTFKETLPGATSITVKGTLRYSSVEYSYDNSSWTMLQDERVNASFVPFSYPITPSGVDIFIRFTSTAGGVNAFFGYTTNPFQILADIDVSSYSRLKNYPTNKDIIKQYSTTLGAPTTSATYRATKWGFPAIEYSATEYQYLDVDTTATGSTVAFSELGTTYTTVADGASLAISSTSTPNLFVKANITANRLYLSSNDTNASSDKDGSLRQTLTYNVIQ